MGNNPIFYNDPLGDTTIPIDQLNPWALNKLGKFIPKNDPRPFAEQVKGDLALASIFAGIFTGGGTTAILRSGLFSSGVSMSFSALSGESGYEIFKSGISGFVSGSVLAGLSGNSIFSILKSGGISGAVGETTNQVLDIWVGNKSGFDLKSIIASGGIGAVSNLIAHASVNKANEILDANLANQISSSKTSAYREMIKKSIVEGSPRIGDRAANKLTNQTILQIQQSLRKENTAAKSAVKQTIEKSIDYLQTIIK
jgi:hypothetical protein